MKNILIITISLVFATSCKQIKQTIKDKVTDVVKEAEHIHVHKTTEWDSRILLHPNSQNVVGRIPKGTEVEILAEELIKQGMLENTWYKVAYEDKIGWVSEHNFNK